MHFWPERKNPRRKKDRKTRGRTEGGRWQELGIEGMTGALTPNGEVHELHHINCPDRLGLDANQGRKNPNVSWQVEGRS